VYSTPDIAVELPNTRDLLTRVAMPAEVLAYLLWSTEAVRIISSWYLAVIFDRRAELALDALEMAIWSRRSADLAGLVHHSDRGVQYLAIRYTERPRTRAPSPRSV
jgi:hypothetical protein